MGGRRSRLARIAARGAATSFLAALAAVVCGRASADEIELREGAVGSFAPPVPAEALGAWRVHGREAAFASLVAEVGEPVALLVHGETAIPSRILLEGVQAPGTVVDGAAAAAHARAFLARHLELLAPGSSSEDFVLVTNELDAGLRAVGFAQRHRGRAVVSGQLGFRYAHDRLVLIASDALPFDGADPGEPPSRGDAELLPIIARGQVSYRWVVVTRLGVEPSYDNAASLRDVFLDAATGAPIASAERLRFSSATLDFHVPLRAPSYGPRIDAPAGFVDLVVNGAGVESATDGSFSFAGPTASVSATASGSNVDVVSASSAAAATSFVIADGATEAWDASTDELTDAQLSTFIHAGEARDYAKGFAPNLVFLNDQVQAIVNTAAACNSYSDGTFIHFYEAGNGCENTGRIADIVYHEYEHSIHAHAVLPGVGVDEPSLSEGVADYFAATMTGDPGVGRGLHFTSAPARDLAPATPTIWPDDLVGEPHADGMTISETLWDLRSLLVAKLGAAAGRAKADALYYQGIERASDIPTMYPEVLAADDDDGDLSNGTPDICEIDEAFGQHGLRGLVAVSSVPSVEAPSASGFGVGAKVTGLFSGCPGDVIADASLAWSTNGGAESTTTPLTGSPSAFSGELPSEPPNTSLAFQMSIPLASGSTLRLPDNPADPWYDAYVGKVAPIYCTDFERDPKLDGWTHGRDADALGDDWEWGAPHGTVYNADPTAAFSGSFVFGTDLGNLPGHDGKYLPSATTWAESPTVDTSGYTEVRLQYRRWLTVEDARIDQASIYANGDLVWRNRASDDGAPELDHRDREWRFQDVDLSSHVRDHAVRVRFELASHGTKQLGGWTLDDFCIVGVPPPAPPAETDLTPRGGVGCEIANGEPNAAFSLVTMLGIALAQRRAARSCKRRRKRVECDEGGSAVGAIPSSP